MGVVAVDALEIGELAVDVDLVVDGLYLAEAMSLEGTFHRSACLVENLDDDGVEVRALGTPQLRTADVEVRREACPTRPLVFVRNNLPELERLRGNGLPVGIEDAGLAGPACLCLATVVEHGDADVTADIGERAEIVVDEHIGDMELGHGYQIDIAMDSAQPEHVLVFEIAAVAPAIHLNGYRVATFLHIGRYVKLGIVVRALAVTHALAVHPYVEG